MCIRNDEIRMMNDEGIYATAVIPSEVEESRDEALELFCGVLRLRCAPLRMTVLPFIGASSFLSFVAY
jgi:hypothetical protein